ncbi:conserved hypothetical protein [Leishmania major strain Friedlin]|uniref:Hypothetical transmembrane protein L6586.03 n=1 Tax=Leishmania major TaxID=5664 RepID=Q9NF82_LEIMA|nr:conserved hypothetical protein [Leishmania major strain Friedlin]CAB71232.1 hypothetical transmembrane protein L6586.03 [Leishmania major]CAG9574218.1 hypothetical_protein_-_conserved [Leishmania major strain Friedlin]CAJ04315.1 conserved hypothetical protein [Leishmania major strain Friedlin]|eukprot:XP_001683395.1 conserved hypothetical protein [Leishmania major strain Friedlin]
MGTGTGCLYACAPFTLIVSILLFMLSAMLRNGNWTFAVLAAKHSWDAEAKSRCCRNGGFMYLFISIVLWVLVVIDSFLIQLKKLPTSTSKWWRQRRLPSLRELMRTRHTASETDGVYHATDAILMTTTPVAAVRTAVAKSPQPSALSAFALPSTEAASPPSVIMTGDLVAADDSRRKTSSAGSARAEAGRTGFVLSCLSSSAMVGAPVGAAVNISSAKPLSSAGQAYARFARGEAQGRQPLLVSATTSAATSAQEVEYLLP